MESSEWFEAWFDTKFYHMLYRHRDEDEARVFIDHLINFLGLDPKRKIQDLACGTGRHSIYLNSIGFDVTGLDLSENSINEAKTFENDLLHFEIHDMRNVYKAGEFDAVFNLFTSFGYFENEADNARVINAVYEGLKPGGIFVLDYLNSKTALEQLPGHEIKAIDGFRFEINKEYKNDRIVKEIHIEKEGRSMSYTESIYPFTEKELKQMLTNAGFQMKSCFGSYGLEKYDPETSDRLIMLAQKN